MTRSKGPMYATIQIDVGSRGFQTVLDQFEVPFSFESIYQSLDNRLAAFTNVTQATFRLYGYGYESPFQISTRISCG